MIHVLHLPSGVLPYKGLMGTCGQPGYVFRDFCLKQGIDFIIFCLNQGIFLNSFVIANGLNKKEFRYLLLSYMVWFWVKCLKEGIKNRNSVLHRVGKSAIFVLNRVRVWGAGQHLPTQGYVEYPHPPGPFARNPKFVRTKHLGDARKWMTYHYDLDFLGYMLDL